MRFRAGMGAGLLALLLLNCSRQVSYSPVFAAVQTGAPSAPGTLKGDYDAAVRSGSLADAATRWEHFLKAHKPPGGEYEDAYQQRLIQSASYELVRVYYLSGAREKGDQLLKDLDPLQLK
jgi:hypothetical protein